jgi:XapX domain-containing protein
MSMSALVGILASLLIGAGCRVFGIPSPAPPKLQGALLVLAMTLGFMLGDRLLG